MRVLLQEHMRFTFEPGVPGAGLSRRRAGFIEQGGVGEAGAAQVADDLIGRPCTADGEAVLGDLVESGLGEIVLVAAAGFGVPPVVPARRPSPR